jgi:hypothetical protein
VVHRGDQRVARGEQFIAFGGARCELRSETFLRGLQGAELRGNVIEHGTPLCRQRKIGGLLQQRGRTCLGIGHLMHQVGALIDAIDSQTAPDHLEPQREFLRSVRVAGNGIHPVDLVADCREAIAAERRDAEQQRYQHAVAQEYACAQANAKEPHGVTGNPQWILRFIAFSDDKRVNPVARAALLDRIATSLPGRGGARIRLSGYLGGGFVAGGDPWEAGGADFPEGGAGASGQSGSALPGSQSAAVVRPPRASATTAEDINTTTARTDGSLRMDFEYRSAQ